MRLKSFRFTVIVMVVMAFWIFAGVVTVAAKPPKPRPVHDPGDLWLGFTEQQAMIPPDDYYNMHGTWPPGYIGPSGDLWLTESWVSYLGSGGFDLWMFNHNYNIIGYDLRLLAAIPTSIKDGFVITVDQGATLVEVMDITDGWGAPLGWPGAGNYPPHGVYVPGTTYYLFDLNYDLSPRQTHSWHITVNNFPVHFDAFGLVPPGENQFISTPPSHDATTMVPEPGTLVLLGCGALGFLPFLRRRKKV